MYAHARPVTARLIVIATLGGPIDRAKARDPPRAGGSCLMAEGRSNPAIGARLFLTPKTVETHVARIFSELASNPRRATTAGARRSSPTCAASADPRTPLACKAGGCDVGGTITAAFARLRR
jgi:hypothetical protein